MEPRGLLEGEDEAGRPRWLQFTGQSVTEDRAVQKEKEEVGRTERKERKRKSQLWRSAEEPSSLVRIDEHICISQGFPEKQKQ